MKANLLSERVIGLTLATQPLFAVLIYISILTGDPPLWLSWLIAIIPVAIRFWRTGRLGKRTPFDIPILIFTFGLIIGFIVSPDKPISWQGLNTYLASILMYYGLVGNTYAKENYWKTVGGLMCLIIVALTIYTIFNGNNRYYFFNEWLNIQPQLASEIKVVRSSYNTPGAALGIAIPFFFAMAIFLRRSRLRYIIIGILVVFSFFLFLIGSGGGWLAAFVGSVFVLAIWKLWTLSFSLPVLGFATWVTISSLSKTSSLAKTWIAKMFPVSSVTSRFQYWGETINLLHGHVLTGVGIGVWFELYPHGKWPVINPHNNYLQVFSDTGLFGIIAMLGAAVAFVYICYAILRSSTKNKHNGIAIGIIGSILAGMVNAFHEVNTSAAIVSGKSITNYIAIPYIWFLAAFLVVVYYRTKPEHDKKAIEQTS